MSSARTPRLANPYSLGVGADQVCGDVPGSDLRSAALSAGVRRTLAVGLLGAGASVGLGVLGQGAAFAEDDETTAVESFDGGGSSDQGSWDGGSDWSSIEVPTVELPDVSNFESSPVSEVGSGLLGDGPDTSGAVAAESSDPSLVAGPVSGVDVESSSLVVAPVPVPVTAPEGSFAPEVWGELDVVGLESSVPELSSDLPGGSDQQDAFPDVVAVEPLAPSDPSLVPASSDPSLVAGPVSGVDVESSSLVVAPVPDRSAPPVLDAEVWDELGTASSAVLVSSTGTDDLQAASGQATRTPVPSSGRDGTISAPPEVLDGIALGIDAERPWDVQRRDAGYRNNLTNILDQVDLSQGNTLLVGATGHPYPEAEAAAAAGFQVVVRTEGVDPTTAAGERLAEQRNSAVLPPPGYNGPFRGLYVGTEGRGGLHPDAIPQDPDVTQAVVLTQGEFGTVAGERWEENPYVDADDLAPLTWYQERGIPVTEFGLEPRQVNGVIDSDRLLQPIPPTSLPADDSTNLEWFQQRALPSLLDRSGLSGDESTTNPPDGRLVVGDEAPESSPALVTPATGGLLSAEQPTLVAKSQPKPTPRPKPRPTPQPDKPGYQPPRDPPPRRPPTSDSGPPPGGVLVASSAVSDSGGFLPIAAGASGADRVAPTPSAEQEAHGAGRSTDGTLLAQYRPPPPEPPRQQCDDGRGLFGCGPSTARRNSPDRPIRVTSPLPSDGGVTPAPRTITRPHATYTLCWGGECGTYEIIGDGSQMRRIEGGSTTPPEVSSSYVQHLITWPVPNLRLWPNPRI